MEHYDHKLLRKWVPDLKLSIYSAKMTRAHASENGVNEEITVVKTATKTCHVLVKSLSKIMSKQSWVEEYCTSSKCHLMSYLDAC